MVSSRKFIKTSRFKNVRNSPPFVRFSLFPSFPSEYAFRKSQSQYVWILTDPLKRLSFVVYTLRRANFCPLPFPSLSLLLLRQFSCFNHFALHPFLYFSFFPLFFSFLLLLSQSFHTFTENVLITLIELSGIYLYNNLSFLINSQVKEKNY